MIREYLLSKAVFPKVDQRDTGRPLMPIEYIQKLPLWELPIYWLRANIKWLVWISLIWFVGIVGRSIGTNLVAYPRRKVFFGKSHLKQIRLKFSIHSPWKYEDGKLSELRVEKILRRYRFPKDSKGNWI